MAEAAVRVALLFGQDALAAPLREALAERAALIVHEGTLAELRREHIEQGRLDVLVVNLRDDDDEALERLYEMIDGARPRVVFNEAASSQRLDGWDRARWARHLAAKVLAQADVDPPRPADAPGYQPALAEVTDVGAGAPSVAEPVSWSEEDLSAELEHLLADQPPAEVTEQAPVPAGFATLALDDGSDLAGRRPIEVEDSLADELAQLMEAEPATPSLEEEFGRGPAFDPTLLEQDEPTGEVSLEPVAEPLPGHLAAWDNSSPPAAPTAPSWDIDGTTGPSVDTPAPEPSLSFSLDHLSLVSLEEGMAITASVAAPPAEASSLQAPAHWQLLDDDAVLSDSVPPPAAFGVEKLSAADFLAPPDTGAPSPLEPGLSLELVSMEEAMAPQAFEAGADLVGGGHYEMRLDTEVSGPRQLVMLGAAADSLDPLAAFLAALPRGLPQPLLLALQVSDMMAEQIESTLAAASALPLRLASAGQRVPRGEVLLVPPGQRARLARSGPLELVAAGAAESPIDALFSMGARAFGRDALAIVFSGRGNDAVAGAQAVHDRGGQVWLQHVARPAAADMAADVQAERLASFIGAPEALAARLADSLNDGEADE